MPIIHTSVMYMATVILRLTKHKLTNMFSTGDPSCSVQLSYYCVALQYNVQRWTTGTPAIERMWPT